MSQLYGLVVIWLFVSRNGIRMQYLDVVGFKSSTLTVYCAPDLFTNNGKHIHICVSFVDSVIYHDFRDLNIFHPLFGFESQIMTLSQKIQKKWFYRSLLFYTTFSWCWRFWYVCTCGLYILKQSPGAVKVTLG